MSSSIAVADARASSSTAPQGIEGTSPPSLHTETLDPLSSSSSSSSSSLHVERGRQGKRKGRKEGTYGVVDESEALADLERLDGISFDDPYHIGGGSLPIQFQPSGGIEEEDDDAQGAEERRGKGMTLQTLYTLFREDWQLSQFCYTDDFTQELVETIRSILHLSTDPNDDGGSSINDEGTKERKTIAFLCSPTAYVGFHHFCHASIATPTSTKLLEFDTPFSLLGADDFVKYDLNAPPSYPTELEGEVDLCIVDPPFLSVDTNHKIAQTVTKIKKPGNRGKVVLVTGDSIVEQVKEMYLDDAAKEQGQTMQRLPLDVRHRGPANEFGVWCNL